MKKILITGSSGFIGSCLYNYLKKKFTLYGIDKVNHESIKTIKCNLLHLEKLNKIMNKIKPDIVIHLAAQSLVDEKINKKKYTLNNLIATKNLLKSMKLNSINKIIFSSTAAVYKHKNSKLKEKDTLKPKSQYAKTKLFCEKIINSEKKINNINLRFFNACSALKTSNIIGELHKPETHLIPTIMYKGLFGMTTYIYGKNFKTKDGTCVRDYVHIEDLCRAIFLSIKKISNNFSNSLTLNIGSSRSLTNNEIIKNVKTILKKDINIKYVKRRKGDVDRLICNCSKAKKLINWETKKSNIHDILKDELSWISYFSKKGQKRTFKNYL